MWSYRVSPQSIKLEHCIASLESRCGVARYSVIHKNVNIGVTGIRKCIILNSGIMHSEVGSNNFDTEECLEKKAGSFSWSPFPAFMESYMG